MKGKQLIVQTGLFLLFLCFVIAANGPVQAGNCVKGDFGHENPADFYCVELGYDLESVTDKDGGQHSICKFRDGTYCDAWEFFQGKCGAEYSFCAQRGYGQITKSDGKDPFSRQYAVCISTPSPEVMSATEGRTTQEVGSVTDLMGLREKYSRGPIPEVKVIEAEPQVLNFAPKVLDAPPSFFDWRDFTGEDWMTPVKNQSSCGSCWAFSAVGVVEAVYNIFSGYADLNLNLSEEFLNSDCSTPNPGSCCGGGHDSALNIIRDDGIPDEDCMAYDVSYYSTGDCSCFPNPPCNTACNGLPASCSNLDCTGVCVDWASRLVSIDAYHAVSDDIDQIKQELVDEGPLSVCLAMSGTYDAQGVYRCSISCWDRNGNGTCETTGTCTAGTCTSGIIGQDCTDDTHCDEDKNDDTICDQNDCGVNHCVVIAGYDDTGQFWITKNSWGSTWDVDGYWNVGFGECHIEKYVRYVDPADINFPPIADANGPYDEECDGTTTDVQLNGSASIDPEGDSLLYNWTTTCSGGTFNDAGSESPTLTIDSSPGCVIDCNVSLTVTDGIGQTDEADALISISDTLTPIIVCPDNEIIECDESTDPENTGTATATDTCDPSPAVSHVDSVVPGACPAESVITRTWTATDVCGNEASCTQTINVVDTTPPVVSCNVTATISPNDAPVSFTASALDNCDTSPHVEILDYRCFKTTKKGKIIDKGESCMVALSGDTVTINDSGGVGDNIHWTTQATDCSGNVTVQECGVPVVNPND